MEAIQYPDELNSFLIHYKYLPALTKKLDDLQDNKFDQALINEIVLWKVNRYVEISGFIASALDNVKVLKNGQHRIAEQLLFKLLQINGIDLPMASTLLRFRNPDVFQIIDRHAHRAIFGTNYSLYSSSNINKKIETYFEYIDKLIEICQSKNLEFKTIDRLLYVFDKKINGSLSKK